ncbi:hypothetical protein SPAN111604_13120 [Sphingomonas antarctica]|uniref:hypothetical protein n=1 Tax=Sphingomonas antarctica TaxID=2040274 RepID=UPI0039E971B2
MISFVLALTSIAPAAGDPGAAVRCVQEDVIGSLVQKRRVCHTVREWRVIEARAFDETSRIVMPGTLNALNNDPDPNAVVPR